MKRDMDLIRELMLKIEDLPVPSGGFRMILGSDDDVRVDGYTIEQIDYHLSLLNQAGFIHTGGLDFGMQFDVSGIAFRSLSWSGHDFLDSVRSPDVWDRTKKAASTAGGFTVDLLVFAAKTYLENRIKGLVGG